MRKTRLVILPGARSIHQIGCLLLFLACPNIAFKGQEKRDFPTLCSSNSFYQSWTPEDYRQLQPPNKNGSLINKCLIDDRIKQLEDTLYCKSDFDSSKHVNCKAEDRSLVDNFLWKKNIEPKEVNSKSTKPSLQQTRDFRLSRDISHFRRNLAATNEHIREVRTLAVPDTRDVYRQTRKESTRLSRNAVRDIPNNNRRITARLTDDSRRASESNIRFSRRSVFDPSNERNINLETSTRRTDTRGYQLSREIDHNANSRFRQAGQREIRDTPLERTERRDVQRTDIRDIVRLSRRSESDNRVSRNAVSNDVNVRKSESHRDTKLKRSLEMRRNQRTGESNRFSRGILSDVSNQRNSGLAIERRADAREQRSSELSRNNDNRNGKFRQELRRDIRATKLEGAVEPLTTRSTEIRRRSESDIQLSRNTRTDDARRVRSETRSRSIDIRRVEDFRRDQRSTETGSPITRGPLTNIRNDRNVDLLARRIDAREVRRSQLPGIKHNNGNIRQEGQRDIRDIRLERTLKIDSRATRRSESDIHFSRIALSDISSVRRARSENRLASRFSEDMRRDQRNGPESRTSRNIAEHRDIRRTEYDRIDSRTKRSIAGWRGESRTDSAMRLPRSISLLDLSNVQRSRHDAPIENNKAFRIEERRLSASRLERTITDDAEVRRNSVDTRRRESRRHEYVIRHTRETYLNGLSMFQPTDSERRSSSRRVSAQRDVRRRDISLEGIQRTESPTRRSTSAVRDDIRTDRRRSEPSVRLSPDNFFDNRNTRRAHSETNIRTSFVRVIRDLDEKRNTRGFRLERSVKSDARAMKNTDMRDSSRMVRSQSDNRSLRNEFSDSRIVGAETRFRDAREFRSPKLITATRNFERNVLQRERRDHRTLEVESLTRSTRSAIARERRNVEADSSYSRDTPRGLKERRQVARTFSEVTRNTRDVRNILKTDRRRSEYEIRMTRDTLGDLSRTRSDRSESRAFRSNIREVYSPERRVRQEERRATMQADSKLRRDTDYVRADRRNSEPDIRRTRDALTDLSNTRRDWSENSRLSGTRVIRHFEEVSNQVVKRNFRQQEQRNAPESSLRYISNARRNSENRRESRRMAPGIYSSSESKPDVTIARSLYSETYIRNENAPLAINRVNWKSSRTFMNRVVDVDNKSSLDMRTSRRRESPIRFSRATIPDISSVARKDSEANRRTETRYRLTNERRQDARNLKSEDSRALNFNIMTGTKSSDSQSRLTISRISNMRRTNSREIETFRLPSDPRNDVRSTQAERRESMVSKQENRYSKPMNTKDARESLSSERSESSVRLSRDMRILSETNLRLANVREKKNSLSPITSRRQFRQDRNSIDSFRSERAMLVDSRMRRNDIRTDRRRSNSDVRLSRDILTRRVRNVSNDRRTDLRVIWNGLEKSNYAFEKNQNREMRQNFREIDTTRRSIEIRVMSARSMGPDTRRVGLIMQKAKANYQPLSAMENEQDHTHLNKRNTEKNYDGIMAVKNSELSGDLENVGKPQQKLQSNGPTVYMQAVLNYLGMSLQTLFSHLQDSLKMMFFKMLNQDTYQTRDSLGVFQVTATGGVVFAALLSSSFVK